MAATESSCNTAHPLRSEILNAVTTAITTAVVTAAVAPPDAAGAGGRHGASAPHSMHSAESHTPLQCLLLPSPPSTTTRGALGAPCHALALLYVGPTGSKGEVPLHSQAADLARQLQMHTPQQWDENRGVSEGGYQGPMAGQLSVYLQKDEQ
jgi:hypothetical protein